MQTAKSTFIGRLLEVLGTRKRHVWGVALGFTNNLVHRMFVETEPLPNTEELAIIGEAENLNLNWLVYGIGPKYRITTFQDFTEFNTAVQDVVQEKWEIIYIAVCQSRCALLTSRTMPVQYKNRDVEIQQIRCLTGPGSTTMQIALIALAWSRKFLPQSGTNPQSTTAIKLFNFENIKCHKIEIIGNSS